MIVDVICQMNFLVTFLWILGQSNKYHSPHSRVSCTKYIDSTDISNGSQCNSDMSLPSKLVAASCRAQSSPIPSPHCPRHNWLPFHCSCSWMILRYGKAKTLALPYLLTIIGYLWAIFQRTGIEMISSKSLPNTHVSWPPFSLDSVCV